MQAVVGYGFRGVVFARLEFFLQGLGHHVLRQVEQILAVLLLEEIGVYVCLLVVYLAPLLRQTPLHDDVVIHGCRQLGIDGFGVGFSLGNHVSVIERFDLLVVFHVCGYEILRLGLHLLHTQQLLVVIRIDALDEIGVCEERAAAAVALCLPARITHVRENEILLDGIYAVDKLEFLHAQREDRILGIREHQQQRIGAQLCQRVALFGICGHGAAHGADDAYERILTVAQLRVVAQQTHILLVTLKARNAGRDILSRYGLCAAQHRYYSANEQSSFNHLHQRIKNS